MKKKIDFNDLPKHSEWPARLLGAKTFQQHKRNTSEVLREYDVEKWGAVLAWLQTHTDFTDTDLLLQQGINPQENILYMCGDDYFTSSAQDVMSQYNQLLIDILTPYNPKNIVELGCGLGDKLVNVINSLNPIVSYGGEFTDSGVSCGKLLAARHGITTQFNKFDYYTPSTLHSIPTNALVYTSHSIEQIPYLPDSFIEELILHSPQCVIHFEPCYEDQNSDTLIGLMRRKYTELNDYNRNLVGLLRSFEERGKLKILEHKLNVFSDTPFNPTSIIIWKPCES
jgi:hypothetical protein